MISKFLSVVKTTYLIFWAFSLGTAALPHGQAQPLDGVQRVDTNYSYFGTNTSFTAQSETSWEFGRDKLIRAKMRERISMLDGNTRKEVVISELKLNLTAPSKGLASHYTLGGGGLAGYFIDQAVAHSWKKSARKAVDEILARKVVIITRPTQGRSLYFVSPHPHYFEQPTFEKLTPAPTSASPGMEVTDMGLEVILGHPCEKVRLTRAYKLGLEILVWKAKDLGNFPLQTQTSFTNGIVIKKSYTEVDLTKPDPTLFEPPPDATPVSFPSNYDDLARSWLLQKRWKEPIVDEKSIKDGRSGVSIAKPSPWLGKSPAQDGWVVEVSKATGTKGGSRGKGLEKWRLVIQDGKIVTVEKM